MSLLASPRHATPFLLVTLLVTAGCVPLPEFIEVGDTTSEEATNTSIQPTDTSSDTVTSGEVTTFESDLLLTTSGSDTDTETTSETASFTEPRDTEPVPCNAADTADVAERCGERPCVDGYCCNSSCQSPCVMCDLPGSEGRCSSVPKGEDPKLACATEAPETCGQTGVCDGEGECAHYGRETECDDSDFCTFDDVCDGVCSGVPVDCDAGFRCSSSEEVCVPCDDTTTCGPTCEQCAPGEWCDFEVGCITCYGDYDCPATQFCLNDKCVPGEDATGCIPNDGPCDAAERCLHGACRIVPTQLAAGTDHTCALLSNGKVRCWGRNDHGQLGYGHTRDIGDDEAPASAGDIDIGGTAIQISAGFAHTCALLDTGRVRCWGLGDGGRLGYGNTATIGDDEPPAAAGDVDLGGLATQIAVGHSHTCALLDTKAVRCWGPVPWTYLGYSEIKTVGDDETPATMGDIPGLANVEQIAAGTHHSCALLDAGNVRCWGNARYDGLPSTGCLGYGNTDSVTTPSADVSIGVVATQITAGGDHTCVLYYDPSLQKAVPKCWGAGAVGQLGYSNPNNLGDDELPSSAGPVPIYYPYWGGYWSESSPVQVAAGQGHTCIARREGVLCWGNASSGQLGFGDTKNYGDSEWEEPGFRSAGVWLDAPAVQVATGGAHTCALVDDGRVRCWGRNDHGQLGYVIPWNIGDDETTEPMGNVAVVRAATAVDAGGDYACTLHQDGGVACWGENADGKLGERPDGPQGSPRDIALAEPAIQVAAGWHHTCVLNAHGGVRCFGHPDLVGYPSTEADTDGPALGDEEVQVDGEVVQLAIGDHHTCGLLDTGTVRCWGENSYGQLGYGHTNDIGDDEIPAAAGDVEVGGTVTEIAAGGYHTCALLDSRALRCWGNNEFGQLGYGHRDRIGDNESPAEAGDVDVGAPVAHVTAGESHTCALLVTGAVRCWGRGWYGALGYGNNMDIGDNEAPSAVGDVNVGAEVVQLAAGGTHTCALTADAAVRCWGRGNCGELGYGNKMTVGTKDKPADVGDVSLGPRLVRQVSAGSNFTCVVFSDGGIRCFGCNYTSQLGTLRVSTEIGEESIGDDERPVFGADVPL